MAVYNALNGLAVVLNIDQVIVRTGNDLEHYDVLLGSIADKILFSDLLGNGAALSVVGKAGRIVVKNLAVSLIVIS